MHIAIDPSINNVGWAIFDQDKYSESGKITSQGDAENSKIHFIGDSLDVILQRRKPDYAVVEIPASFTYSKAAVFGKSLNQSAMNKLSMATGAIIYVCEVNQVPVRMVHANEWKAGRPKDMDKMLAKGYTDKKITDHEADAIMLAAYGNR